MSRLTAHLKALDYCTYCPKLCTFACPVSNAEQQEAFTPWAKMTIANLLRKEKLDFSAENVEPLYHCLACRLCTTFCKHENDVGQVLSDARAELIERGIVHPGLAKLKANWDSHDNAYGLDLYDRLHALLGPERFVPEAQVVYFPGAATIAERESEITAAFNCFDKLGIDTIACYPGNQLAAGYSLYRAGFRDEFATRAERLANQLLRYKLIVTSCPDTLYTLTALFLELDINLTGRVKHVLDVIWPEARRRELDALTDGVPTVHDATAFARYMRRMDLPRDIVRALYGLDPVEMVYSKESAYSSGAQGVFAATHPEAARAVARERLRQAREVRATTILTTSPKAAAWLAAAREPGDADVLTLTEQLNGCLTGD